MKNDKVEMKIKIYEKKVKIKKNKYNLKENGKKPEV